MKTKGKKIQYTELLLSVGFALAGSALAQQISSGESSLENPPAVTQQLLVAPGYSHTFDSDFDKSGLGHLSIDRVDARVAYAVKFDENTLTFGGLYEFSHYDLSEGGTENFNRLGTDALYQGMANENWGYFGYVAGQFSASEGADFGEGLMGTSGGGARYVWSPALSVNFGLAYSTSLEDDNRILPIIILNWQINEKWSLRTFNGAILSYDISGDKKNILSLRGRYELREYRLPNNSRFGSTRETKV